MRTSNKIFFLSLALGCLSAISALSQPVFSIQNKKDACNGLQNGSFDINVTSGTGSISAFIFSSGAPIGPVTLTVGTPTTISSLKGTAGGTSYLVVVSDDNGSSNTSTTIFLLSNVSVSLTSKQDVTTCSPVNGAIDITPSGGSGTYTYAWTGPSGFTATTQDLSNVGAGDYSVVVSDAGTTCSASLGPITLTIASPSITLGSIPGVCSGTSSSTLSYSATVGSPDKYNIDWDATANAAGLADVALTNLPATPITISGLPTVVTTTTFNGLLYVTNSGNGCVSAGNAISVTVTANVTPSVSISASPSSTICANQSVTFTATPTNGGAAPSYQWKKNGANVGSNSSTYTDATLANSDQISVVMTSNASCLTTPTATSNTITMTVTANVTPSVSIAASPSNTICAGQSVTFTATPTNGGTPSYQWKKNGSNVGSNSATYTDAALANGDAISVVMTSSITCVTSPTATSNTINMTVTAIVTPSVSIAAAPGSTICTGTSVTFTATPTNGGATPSYQWRKNGANVGSNSATYTDAALVTNDKIDVILTSSLTCVTSATATSNLVTMTVNPLPTITAGAIPGVCSGTTNSTLPYSAVTGSPDKYSIDWDATANAAGLADVASTALPASPISITGLPTVVSTTTFNGLLYVTNSTTTCQSTGVAISVTVTANVTPSVSIVAAPVSPICSGTSVTFTATPTNGGATPSYQWKKNGSNVGSNSTTYTDAALANGDQISVVMTTSLTCVTSATATSSTITMTVNTPVVPSVSIVAAPVSPICSGTNVTFTATPTNGGATPSYQWKKNGSNVGSNSATYSDAALVNGDQISVVMTTSLTCVTTPTATSNTITMTVTTPVTPSVSIVSAPVSPICSGTSVTFTATPTNGGATPSYQWTKNGSNVGSNSTTYTDAALANGDQIAVVMTTSLTCVTSPTGTSNTITMTVTTPVTPSVSIVSAPVSPICSGTSVTFTATPTNGGATPSYQWTKNGSNVGSNSATYTDATLANGDQVAVVMTTSLTCVTTPTATSSTITMTVTAPVTPSVSISANPGVAICSGISVTFTATPTNGGATPTYQWKKNGSNVGSNSTTYTDAALANGDQVSVVLTTSLTCVTSATATSNTLTMAVTPSVTPTVSIAAAPGASICSGVSVTFTATPTNGGTTPSYQWVKNGSNVGSNSSTYTDATLANGDQVSVIMTSNAACTTTPTASSNTITMTVNTPVTPSVSISPNPGSTICSGTSVMFTATPTNGGATPSYQWKKNGSNVGSNSATYTDASLANGDQITVVMTTSLTCVTSPTATSSAVTMTVNTVSFTFVKSDVTCNGGNDGFIHTTPSGGSGTYTFSDDNGVTFQASKNFNTLTAATYKVVVQDGNGCLSPVSTIVIGQPAAVTFTTTKTNVTCNGNNDGTIKVTASGGNGTYTYSDDNGTTFQAGNTFSGLAPATYTIIVKDGNGCTSTATPVTITEPAVVSFTFTSNDVTCNGGNDGKITVTASGGSGSGYIYSKDNGTTFQASNVFSGLTAANYNVIVKDGNGCLSSVTMVPIIQPSAVTFTQSSVDVTCNGGNTGSITVTASGGNGTFTYSKDNGSTFQASNVLNNLTAATYNVVVKDGNGCLSAATPVTINEPGAITFGTSKTDVTTCTPGNDGSITVSSAAGGSGAGYTYSIDNGTTFQGGNVFSTLVAGLYQVVVKDGAGCVSAASPVTITSPGALSFTTTQINVSCNGGSDGSITITSTGGTGTYTYSKDNGATFSGSGTPFTFNALTAATYQLVVKDGSGCQFSASVVITEPAVVSFTTTSVDATCNGGNNGSITVTASGGSGSYSYSSDNGATFQASNVFNGLTAATYQVIVKDGNGCATAASAVMISEPAVVTFTNSSIDVTCNGGNDGSITVTASGGSGAGYTYSKDNGATFQASNVLNGLTAATYQVVVKDGNGCLSTATGVTINEPSSITFSAAKTDVTSCGGSDGTITVSSPAGGSGSGYVYSIDNGATFQGSGNYTSLSAGNYQVVVKDGVNCTSAPTLVTIIAPGALSFTTTQTNVSCNGANDGSITITPSGGSGTYTYSKDNGATFTGSGSPFTFNTLTAATYQLVVKDGNGCQFSSSTTVTEPAVLTTGYGYPVSVTCHGSSNGSITMNPTGGTAPYLYSIDGGATFQAASLFSGLFAGTYSAVVKDANLCSTAPFAITIADPAAITFSTSKVDATTCSSADGQIAVNGASGGIGSSFTYSDDNGATFQASNLFNGLLPGSYNIVVQDNNGCTSSPSAVTISSPGGLTFTTAKTDVTCIGGTNGTITVTVSGGTAPFQYSSDNGATFQGGNVFNGLSPATYSILVKDVNGCQFTSSVTIGQPAAVTFTFVKVDAGCSGSPTGSITVTASGGNNLYTYSDDNGTTYQASNVFGSLAAQTYPVMVKDGNGCLSSATSVTINAGNITPSFTKTDATTCAGTDGSIVVNSVTGGTAPYTYSINNGGTFQASNTFTNLSVSTYSLVVKDNTGCTSSSSSISVNKPGGCGGSGCFAFTSITHTDIRPSCTGNDDGQITINVSGGTSPYAVTLYDSITNPATPKTFGPVIGLGASVFGTLSPSLNYQYIVQDAAGNKCPGTVSLQIQTTVQATASGFVNSPCYNQAQGQATITVTSGGNSPYVYSLDNGATWVSFTSPATITNLMPAANPYSILVADDAADQCPAQVSVTIANAYGDIDINNPNPPLVADASCANNDGAITIQNVSGGAGAPYTFVFDGQSQVGLSYTGLSAKVHTFVVSDANSCSKTYQFTVKSPGYVDFTPVVTNPTCTGGGTDGKIDVTINTPGNFDVGYTTDIVNTPPTYIYTGISNLVTPVTLNNLAQGKYYVVVRPNGAGCATDSLNTINGGPVAVSFDYVANDFTCSDAKGTIDVSNIKGSLLVDYSYEIIDTLSVPSVITSGTLDQTQAMGTVRLPLTQPGLDNGMYRIRLFQDQSASAGCATPITSGYKTFAVHGPDNVSFDTASVVLTKSKPALATGEMLIQLQNTFAPPYLLNLHLLSSDIPGQNNDHNIFDAQWVVLDSTRLPVVFDARDLYAGLYRLSIVDKYGCKRIDSLTIGIDSQIFIPNIFTPNNDGKNDTFEILNLPPKSSILITNRWGKEVFKSNLSDNASISLDPNNPSITKTVIWTGDAESDGIYYYTLSTPGKTYNGWVEIQR
jgi:hypothetical protein